MNKLRREIEFLESGMQRVRTKLDRLQKRPNTNSLNVYNRFKTKWLVDPQDYYDREQTRIQVNSENDMCIDPYLTKEANRSRWYINQAA